MKHQGHSLLPTINTFRTTCTIAKLEIKKLVTSVALWILCIITTIIIFINYFDITIKYSVTEIISPLNGIVNTEYIKFSLITQTFLLIAPLILSILVAKIRVQAIRDRIKPVLDSRPISNFQLLHGHAIGLVALLFLIYAFSFSLLFVLATVLAIIGVLNWSMGAGLEFFIAVIAFDVFPLLAFWTGVATILNSTINSRTVNIIIIAALSVLLYIIMHQAPMTLAAHLGHVGMLTISLPSSIVDNENRYWSYHKQNWNNLE